MSENRNSANMPDNDAVEKTSDLVHVISMSGGKDSTATRIVAMERDVKNIVQVFADTGHEHDDTYRYLDYLETIFGKIVRVRNDFRRLIDGKRRYIEAHWLDDLTSGREGHWEWRGPNDERPDTDPPAPRERYRSAIVGNWKWRQSIRPWSKERAQKHIEIALDALRPTGNPFLDLCIWKGRFPSTRRRFCSQYLKHEPIRDQVYEPLLADGHTIVSWQGVRADESASRAKLDIVEQPTDDVIVYRPIIAWTVDDVFAAHRRHGIRWNPLYEQGMGRVGCMPCIHAGKREIAEIAKRFPEVIERLERWERTVSSASKYGIATFGDIRNIDANSYFDLDDGVNLIDTNGIRRYVQWASTARGGKQLQMDLETEIPSCSSIYHLCESAR